MKNVKNLSKRGLSVFLALAMCVGMLQTTAFAAEGGHTHNEDGWTCTPVKELTCEKHVHGDDCYKTERGDLTCQAAEHTHDDGCYAVETVTVCTNTDEDHEHGDDCYETRRGDLTCQVKEHTHGDDCYAVETVKVCLEEDHKHEGDCYTVVEGEWTCVAPAPAPAPEPDDDAGDADPEVNPPVENLPAELPEAVKGFVDAMAELPEADGITEDNAAQVGEKLQLLEDASDAAMDYLNDEEVYAAFSKYMEVFAAVAEVLDLISQTHADPYEIWAGEWWDNNNVNHLNNWIATTDGDLVIQVRGHVHFNGPLVIPSNKKVTIVGNGYNIWRRNDTALFQVYGTLSMEYVTVWGVGEQDKDNTGNAYKAWQDGNAWWHNSLAVVETGGTLNLNSGAKLWENSADCHGGGVYVHSGGTLNANSGSTIVNCNAKDESGAIYVEAGAQYHNNGGSVNGGVANGGAKSAFNTQGDHGRVYLTINTQAYNGLPGEPSVVTSQFIWVTNKGNDDPLWGDPYAIVGKNGDPAAYIKEGILTSPYYIKDTASESWGVSDPTGQQTGNLLQPGAINWGTILDDLASRSWVQEKLKVLDSSGNPVALTDSNKGQYEIIPYVIKYQTEAQGDDNKIGWHIDCAVVPKTRVQVDYMLNLPNGVSTGSAFAVPTGKIGYGSVTLDPVASLKYNNSEVTTSTTIEAAYTGYDKGIHLKFKGWATSADGQVEYQPGQSENPTFTQTTTLYARWEVTEPSYKVQWLDENNTPLKTEETRYPTLAQLSAGTVSVTDADKASIEKGGVTYVFDSANDGNVTSAELKESGTVLTLYFKAQATYTVQWLVKGGTNEDGTPKPDIVLKEDTTRAPAAVGTTVAIKEADKATFTSEDGKITYVFDDRADAGNVLSATLAQTGTVLKLYFKVNSTPIIQPTQTIYLVQWLVKGSDGNDTVVKSAVRGPKDFGTVVSVEAADKNDFTVTDEDDKTIAYRVITDEDAQSGWSATLTKGEATVLKLYVKPQATYTVKWLDADGKELKPSVERGPADVGTEVSIEETDDDDIIIIDEAKRTVTYKFNAAASTTSAKLEADGSTELKLYFKGQVDSTEMDIYARYLVQWLTKDGTVVKSDVRGPEAIGTTVKVTAKDKESFEVDGKTYRFDAANTTGNVLERQLAIPTKENPDTLLLKLYVKQTVTVTYNANGGTLPDGLTADPITVDAGTTHTVAAKATPPEGKHFTGWKLDESNTYQPNAEITVNANITLTAQYAAHTYEKLTRKDNSYVTAPNCIADGTAVYVCDHEGCGAEATLTVPNSKTGHNFTDASVVWKDGNESGIHTDGCTSTQHKRVCKNCGGTLTGGTQLADHTYPEEWTVDRAATMDAEGLKHHKCTDCDHTVYETIPTLDKVTITVNFTTVNDEGETVVVGTETKVVAKGTDYDVTEEAAKIPTGYVRTDDPITGNLTGPADDNKTVTVPVRKIVYAAAAEDVTVVYDGQTHGVTATFTKDGAPANADEGTVTITYATMARSAVDGEPKNAGVYTATITAKVEGQTVSTTATVTIDPATLTVKTDSASKTYDGKALTAGGSVTGLVDGETVTLTTTGSQTAVGHSDNTYELTWDGTALEGNYSVVNVELGTLTVNRRPTPVDPDPVDPGPGPGPGPGPDPDDPDPIVPGGDDPVNPGGDDPDPVDPGPIVDIDDPNVPLIDEPIVDIDDPDVPLIDEPIVDIDDPDVPLADLPGLEDSLVEILDTDVPLADVPKTGDLSLLWHMITLLSAAGLMTLTLLERRQRREK